MKLRYRILSTLAILVAVGIASAAIVVSYDSPCTAPDPVPEGAEAMHAIVHRCYGSPDVLKYARVAKPIPADDEVLVKVHVAAINPLEWHYMTGTPYLMRMSAGFGAPEDGRIGVDFAGTVEAVGKNVTRFKPGDEIFGGGWGALAEYAAFRENKSVVLKPANVSFEHAAAIPIAGITALQAVRDHGRAQAGQKVLINGASGGVGTFAVQLAKSFGAEVTGVCSTRNVELVQSLGADHVIDYTREDFTQSEERYDLIIDNVGNRGPSELTRVLKPNGRIVLVGGPKGGRWIGPLSVPLKAAIVSPFVEQEIAWFQAKMNQQDMTLLGELASAGKLKVVIDRRYALSEVPEAMRYLQTWRTRGKIIIDIEDKDSSSIALSQTK